MLVGIWLLIYIIIIIVILRKYLDIITNKEKYMEAKLHKKSIQYSHGKNYSGFFKSLSHKYNVIYGLPIFLLSIGSFILIGNIYIKLLVLNKGTPIYFGTTISVGVLAFMFLSIPLIMAVIPLHIKKVTFAVILQDVFNAANRAEIWRKAFLMWFIFHIIGFPFIYFSLNNYGYYNDDGFYSSQFFEVNGEFINYEDIEEIKVYSWHNNDGETTGFHYDVIYSKGKVINMNGDNRNLNQTYQFHLLLEKKYEGTFNVPSLKESDLIYLENLSEINQSKINYILEGIH